MKAQTTFPLYIDYVLMFSLTDQRNDLYEALKVTSSSFSGTHKSETESHLNQEICRNYNVFKTFKTKLSWNISYNECHWSRESVFSFHCILRCLNRAENVHQMHFIFTNYSFIGFIMRINFLTCCISKYIYFVKFNQLKKIKSFLIIFLFTLTH